MDKFCGYCGQGATVDHNKCLQILSTRRHKKVMTIQQFHKGMKENFGINNPQNYLDELYLRSKTVKIDLLLFDDWLHAKFGEYETDGMNMADMVHQKFGLDAKMFIESLI